MPERQAAVFVKSVGVGDERGLDPINDIAVEWALRLREGDVVARVVAVCASDAVAAGVLRRALATGCDEAIAVADDALAVATVHRTAHVLAAAARRIDASVAVFGYESLDGSSGTVPAAVATLLGWPVISRARTITPAGELLRVERDIGDGDEVLEATGPVVLSCVDGGAPPRHATLKALVEARRACLTELRLDDLDGIPPTDVPTPVTTKRVVGGDAGRTPRVVNGARAGVDEILAALRTTGAV